LSRPLRTAAAGKPSSGGRTKSHGRGRSQSSGPRLQLTADAQAWISKASQADLFERGMQAIFVGDPEPIIQEAWQQVQRTTSPLTTISENSLLEIDLGRTIGHYERYEDGQRVERHPTSVIRIGVGTDGRATYVAPAEPYTHLNIGNSLVQLEQRMNSNMELAALDGWGVFYGSAFTLAHEAWRRAHTQHVQPILETTGTRQNYVYFVDMGRTIGQFEYGQGVNRHSVPSRMVRLTLTADGQLQDAEPILLPADGGHEQASTTLSSAYGNSFRYGQ
jgi:hypothetical protein